VPTFHVRIYMPFANLPSKDQMAYSRKRRSARPARRTRRSYPMRRRRSSTVTRRAAPKRQRRNTGVSSCECGDRELSPAAKFALAQIDPFHPKTMGAKIPDSNTMPSIANSDIDIVNHPSATGGQLSGIAFRPNYTWGTVPASSGITLGWGAAFTTNAVNRQKRSNYATVIELARPVAHAIRLSSSLAPTAATGFVHIGLSHETTYGAATWDYPTDVTSISGLAYYKRVTLASLTQSPLTVINKWLDETAFRYVSPSTNQGTSTATGFQTDYGWANIVVIVEGAPAGVSPLSYEHLLLSEGLPQKDAVIIGSQAAPNSPGIMQATSTMQSNTEFAHSEEQQESYISRGVQELAAGARDAGEKAFNEVAVPILHSVGQAVVNTGLAYAYSRIRGTGGLPGVNSNPARLSITS